MQTSTRTPQKIISKTFSRGFVTNEMYSMAGESLSKSDYQKSVKSKMAANDSRKKEIAMTNWCISNVNVSAGTDVGLGSLKQPAI